MINPNVTKRYSNDVAIQSVQGGRRKAFAKKCGYCGSKFSKKRGNPKVIEMRGVGICNNCSHKFMKAIEQQIWLGKTGL